MGASRRKLQFGREARIAHGEKAIPSPKIHEGHQPGCQMEMGGVLLLCVKDLGVFETIKRSMKGWIRGVIRAGDTQQALLALSKYPISIVVYWDGFEGEGHRGIWEYLSNMPGEERRKLIVIWVGEGVHTGDPMAAFSKSADLVVHPSDISHVAQLVQRVENDHRRLYGPFLSILHSITHRA